MRGQLDLAPQQAHSKSATGFLHVGLQMLTEAHKEPHKEPHTCVQNALSDFPMPVYHIMIMHQLMFCNAPQFACSYTLTPTHPQTRHHPHLHTNTPTEGASECRVMHSNQLIQGDPGPTERALCLLPTPLRNTGPAEDMPTGRGGGICSDRQAQGTLLSGPGRCCNRHPHPPCVASDPTAIAAIIAVVSLMVCPEAAGLSLSAALSCLRRPFSLSIVPCLLNFPRVIIQHDVRVCGGWRGICPSSRVQALAAEVCNGLGGLNES